MLSPTERSRMVVLHNGRRLPHDSRRVHPPPPPPRRPCYAKQHSLIIVHRQSCEHRQTKSECEKKNKKQGGTTIRIFPLRLRNSEVPRRCQNGSPRRKLIRFRRFTTNRRRRQSRNRWRSPLYTRVPGLFAYLGRPTAHLASSVKSAARFLRLHCLPRCR